MTKLRSATGTLGALKAMRMNEKLTNRTYEKAMELDLTPAVREVLEVNLDDERRHLAAIEAHIARLGGADDLLGDERDDSHEGDDVGRLEPDMSGVRM